ncbi:MAG: histidine phosphatase family protein [Planctomycetia bacterium]|nr:histidine phosphatase family protein [Planctomycetia bacterium]
MRDRSRSWRRSRAAFSDCRRRRSSRFLRSTLALMADHLLVLRAGVTAYDLDGRLRGTLDMPLAAAGVAEARRLGVELAASPPTSLHAADDGPSGETARLIGDACGLRPRTVAGLTNLDQGLWQGMLVEEIRRKQPRLHRQWLEHPWSVVPPEGESLEEACARVDDIIGRLLRRRPRGTVALVVPWPLDRIVLWVAAGRPLDDVWTADGPETQGVRLPVAGQWRSSRRSVPVG